MAFFCARRRPGFLRFQFLIGVIEILQVIIRHHAQYFNGTRLPLRMLLLLEVRNKAFDHLRPDIFSIDSKAAMPREMIQPKCFQIRPLRIDLFTCSLFEPLNDVHFCSDWHIANTNRWNIRRVFA